MRTPLFALTIVWICVAFFTYPLLYLMVGFANDNPTDLIKLLTPVVLLFYFQMLIQSVAAISALKRITQLKQYLQALLIIVLAPLILIICITITMQFRIEAFFLYGLIGSFGLHIVGSIWMWILIGSAGKGSANAVASTVPASVPTVEPVTVAPLSVSPQSNGAEPTVIPSAAPVAGITQPPVIKKRRPDIIHIFLYAPVAILVLLTAFALVTSVVGAFMPNNNFIYSPVIEFIGGTFGTIFALSMLPAATAAVIILVNRKKPQ